MAHWDFDVHDWPTTNKQVFVAWSHVWLAEHCRDNMQLFLVVVSVVVVVGVLVALVVLEGVVFLVGVVLRLLVVEVVGEVIWVAIVASTRQITTRSLL